MTPQSRYGIIYLDFIHSLILPNNINLRKCTKAKWYKHSTLLFCHGNPMGSTCLDWACRIECFYIVYYS